MYESVRGSFVSLAAAKMPNAVVKSVAGLIVIGQVAKIYSEISNA